MQNQMERWNRGAHSVQVIYLVKLSFAEKIKSFICIRHSQRIKRAIHAGKSAPMNKCHSLRESVIHWEEKKNMKKVIHWGKSALLSEFHNFASSVGKIIQYFSSVSTLVTVRTILTKYLGQKSQSPFSIKKKRVKRKKTSEGAK